MVEFNDGISICMIIKNEEKYLRECLTSIKEFADEIIIVDTGSKDKSLNIAHDFTDKIFFFQWVDDFSKARNYALSKATRKWILSLDADERILEEDIPKIKELLKNKEYNGFRLKWRDYSSEIGIQDWHSTSEDIYKESKKFALGYTQLEVVRLFKNSEHHYFEGIIHETLDNSIHSHGGKIADVGVTIHHIGNMDKEKFNEKKIDYLKLLKKRWQEKDFNEKSEHFICFEIYKESNAIQDYEGSLFFIKRAVELDENPTYLAYLGLAYLNLKKLDEAEMSLKKALSLNPYDYSTHLNLGNVYIEQKEYYKALRKFERALELNPKGGEAYFNLGVLYHLLKKKDKSSYFFEKAIEINPSYKKRLSN